MDKKVGCDKGKRQCDCRERIFDEFLSDIENDLKKERYQVLWNKHGKWISAVGTLILGGLAVLALWQRYERGQRAEASTELLRAQNLAAAGKTDEALGIVRFLSTKHLRTYPVLAKFSQAALLAESDFEKNVDTILVLYEDLLSAAPAYYAEVASVLYASTLLRKTERTPLSEEQAKKALKILKKHRIKVEKGQSATGVALLAKELEGRIYLQRGKLKKARKAFDDINRNENAPQHMRLRVQLLIQSIQDRPELDEAAPSEQSISVSMSPSSLPDSQGNASTLPDASITRDGSNELKKRSHKVKNEPKRGGKKDISRKNVRAAKARSEERPKATSEKTAAKVGSNE